MSAATDFPCPLMSTSSGIVMNHSSLTFGRISVAQRQLSSPHDRLCDFLRARHPLKTAECVEAETNGSVKAHTVKKWFERASLPSYLAYSALIAAYGAEFVVATTEKPPKSIRDAAALERDQRYERRRAELEAQLESEFNR